MMLLDSNIIIYAALPEHAELRQFSFLLKGVLA